MDAQPQPNHSNDHHPVRLWQKVGIVILGIGLLFYFGFYHSPSIHEQMNCSDNSHCILDNPKQWRRI